GKVFTSSHGTRHRIIHTGEYFRSSERGPGVPSALAAPPRTSFEDEEFTGVQRKVAKTSIAKAPTETFDTLDDLLVTLPADAKMTKHKQPISKAASSDRVAEEKRNVTVTAYLYAASREADNDFHLIIGGDPDDEDRLYMNVEISGLPKGPF